MKIGRLKVRDVFEAGKTVPALVLCTYLGTPT